jgi:hypothetical protein
VLAGSLISLRGTGIFMKKALDEEGKTPNKK